MCSSPKSSSTKRRHVLKKALTSAEYAEYSAMLKRSFASYEQVQQQKAARIEQASEKAVAINVKTIQITELKPEVVMGKGFWMTIKNILSYELFSQQKNKYAI
jgi:hypothetical protein